MTPWERRLASAAALVALGLGLGVPAQAETIYGWRTEDGAYAYTDDPKAIPARYRAEAKPQAAAPLRGYAPVTSEDPAATDRYAAGLAARLERLRALNAEPEQPRVGAVTAGALTAGGTTVSLRLGGENSPRMDLTTQSDGGPVVVETVHTRPRGKMIARRSVVVRQGDRTLAIVKPRLRQTNISTDVYDESELER